VTLHVIQPRPRLTGREIARIVLSMTMACLVGAAVLGVVYLATDRYRRNAAQAFEREAIRDMLGVGAGTRLLEVRQFLEPRRRLVVYRAAPLGATSGEAREVTFTLDGAVTAERRVPAAAPVPEGLEPLGRLFVASNGGGAPAGFVVEGETRGYKSHIRMFVAMKADFEIADVRIVEQEEDPGLGAEATQPWFREQFVGRTPDELARLSVIKFPMPEDWKAALIAFARRAPDGPARHRDLLERERTKPIYAITGATITSRAVTEGVRSTVDHFRRRWWLLAPHLEGSR
jgi:electron transport complex protein RnfG